MKILFNFSLSLFLSLMMFPLMETILHNIRVGMSVYMFSYIETEANKFWGLNFPYSV